MDFDGVTAVFLGVGFGGDGRGELAGLAGHDEAGPEPAGEGRAHDKAPGFDPDDFRDALVLVELVGHVDDGLERFRVLEEGRHVVEKDARNGIVRDGTDGFSQFFQGHRSSQKRYKTNLRFLKRFLSTTRGKLSTFALEGAPGLGISAILQV